MEQLMLDSKPAALSKRKGLRMLGINEVMFTGRITKEPTVRRSIRGRIPIHFTVAINRRCKIKSANGSWKQGVDYIPVVLWTKIADTPNRLTKGLPLYVQGYLKSEKWTAPNGSPRFALRVNAHKIRSFAKIQPKANGSSVV